MEGRLPSEVINQRRQLLNSMKIFVEEKKAKLTEILEKTGLSKDDLVKVKTRQVCPYNQDHIVPEDKLKKHTEVCKLLHAGYQKDELGPQLQDHDVWYKKWDKILKVETDENLLNKIIWDHCVQNGQVYTGHRQHPESHIEENILLSQEDRLAVYKHVVTRAREAGKVIPWDKDDELLTTDWGALVKKGLLNDETKQGFSSKLEQLAALRDLKRRRQSYRAKNVHITKKSYTEIIREVIVNQMELLKPVGEEDEEEEDSRTSQRRSSRGSSPAQSRSTAGKSDRRRDGRTDRGQSSDYHYRDREDRSEYHKDREERRRNRYDRERTRDSRGRDGGRDRRDRSRDREDKESRRRARDSVSPEREGERRYEETYSSHTSETQDALLKCEIKHENDDNEDVRDTAQEDKNRSRRKREHSSSDESVSSDEESRSRHKHKKSKHKKKHSKKKHKRHD